MRPVRLVVLGHYEDINAGFRDSVATWEPDVAKILIRDGEEIPWDVPGWTVVDGDLPFQYAKNVNLAFTVTGNADVVLCGDDIRFQSPFIAKLREAAYSDPAVGVATVQLYGASPFVAGYWKRNVLDAVGKMDEQFAGYGYDDNDFLHRMEHAGFHTLCVDGIVASHGGGSTFFRRQSEGGPNVQITCDENRKKFNAKWGTDVK